MKRGCVILGHSRGPPTLSKCGARQSGEVYQLEFLGMLHEVIVCSSPQKGVTFDQSGNELVFLEIEMATTPGKNVELLKK